MCKKKCLNVLVLHKKMLILSFMLIQCVVSAFGQVTIEMTPKGKVYSLPGKVNGLELNFIFDTGASDVYLSLTEAVFMLKNGYLTKNDFTGVSYSQIANGDIVENTTVLLREVEIGGIKIHDVTASISHNLDAPLLLGQSAIQKLGPIQLDGNKLIIQNGKNFKSDKQAWDLYYKSFQDIEAENYENAILNLTKALECATDKKLRSLLYGELATAYYRSNKKELAIECCHKGLGEDLMNEQLGYNLGVYLYEMGEIKQAEKAFSQQISKFEKIAPSDKNMRAATYSYLAEIQYSKGEYINAETNYKKSLDISVSSAAYFGLGDVYGVQKQYIKAAEQYEKGIAYEPNRPSNVKRYNLLGHIYMQVGQYEKAYDKFLTCITTMEKNEELFDLAMQSGDKDLQNVYADLMQCSMNSALWVARLAPTPEECIKNYNNIMQISHMKEELMPQDFINQARAYNYLRDTDKEKAVLEEATILFPDDIEVKFLLSLLLGDNHPRIIEILTEILKYENQVQPTDFDYATVYNNIAWSYCCLKQYEKGLPFAEKSVALNSGHDYSWETLGELYFFLHRYEDCVEAMTKCLSCLAEEKENKSYKSALLFRGKALMELGKKKEGKKDLERASKL